MTKYATNNPIGSMDPKDLFDNAQNLDYALNDITKAIWTDRLGRSRKSYWGMEQAFSAQLFSQQQRFFAQILSQQQRFDSFIQSSGYQVIGEYTDGPLTVTDYNQLISYQGELYKLTAATPLDFNTTGNDATSWANDSTHFVSVGDAALRQELASRSGSEMVGYSSGDLALFDQRKIVDVLKSSLRFDDFKGITDDEKWASFIAYISTDAVTAISLVFSGRRHYFTANPAQITKPFTFYGQGCRNTILIFTNCDGIRADLSGYGSRYTQSKISGMALVADSSNTKIGLYFKGVQSFAPHDPALVLDDVSLNGFWDINSDLSPVTTEWATAIYLDDVDEVYAGKLYICGSQNNASYAGRTSSKAIFTRTVTGLRIHQSSINLCGLGVEITGQSEGAVIATTSIVAVDIGILMRDLAGSSNNHFIVDTHISAYTVGIDIRRQTSSGNPTAFFMSKLFILEREGVPTKPLYTAINCHALRSVIDSVTIQANTNNSPSRRAINISNQGNVISNILCHNAGEILRIDGYDTGYVTFSNVRATGATSTLLAGSIEFAVGTGMTTTSEATVQAVRCDTFRTNDVQGREQYSNNGGRHLFGGGRHNSNVYHDFRCSGGGAPSFDGRILFTGGSATVDGQAQATVYASTLAIAGHLASATANAFTCGTAGRPWSGGFTQTAFTITSDERAKTKPLEITDDMLDAWSEVEWCQYKLRDRVEEKGEAARWHHGVVAQRAAEAFARYGLDPHEYGFFCFDEWDAAKEVVVFHEASPNLVDEGGNMVESGREAFSEVATPAREAGDRYSIRYEEAFALEAALQRRNYSRLLKRIEALERATRG